MHGTRAGGIIIYSDVSALLRLRPGDITNLTEAATNATFYRDDLTADEIAANRRVVAISAASCSAAAENGHQHFAAAFAGDRLAGYVIATRHGPDDLELDWLMVHPDQHGSGVAARLMQAGIDWLGADRPIWLNVIRHNERAIRFYRRFGFEIDRDATTSHVVPHWIMRRPAGAYTE
jgi:ribosomal protein S18 acetylase RimI-like enzyme